MSFSCQSFSCPTLFADFILQSSSQCFAGLPRDDLVRLRPDADVEARKVETKGKSGTKKKAEKSTKQSSTASVTTAKATQAHTAAVQARDAAYQVR